MAKTDRAKTDTAERLVAGGAAMMAASVLADSAIEHYRGSFRNPAMTLPLAASSVSLGYNLSGLRAGRPVARGASVAIGLVGLGFHLFNVGKRPGGTILTNLFYGAPLGAPAALILAGVMGAASDGLAREDQRIGPLRLRDGRAIAALAAFGIVGTVSEAALLHLRGAFHNPAMWAPIVLPPVAAAALAVDAARGKPGPATKPLLGATMLLGFAGVALHAYGVSRAMGGWTNWRQNVLDGPPIPAPPAFTGLALAGVGALLLMGRKRG